MENNRANQFAEHIFGWNYLRFSEQPRKVVLSFQMEKHIIEAIRMQKKMLEKNNLDYFFLSPP